MQLKVGVLMGGLSGEKEVSIASGNAVVKACVENNFKVKEIIFGGINDGLIKESENVDIIFNALHGGAGENGEVQSFFKDKGIKYTGSDEFSSKLCMDKDNSKLIAQGMGLATPKWELMKSFSNAPQIDFPIIVKPNDQGSTLGLSIVEDEKFLKEALDRSFKFSKSIMMESYISGRELAVSILDEMALPIVEIIPSKKIYDYECKYTPGKSSYSCPAELNPIVDYHIKKDSELLFKHLGCKAYGRADFLLDENGNYYFLEMNTLPGMTRTSLFPKASKAAGISFNELILRIIKKSL